MDLLWMECANHRRAPHGAESQRNATDCRQVLCIPVRTAVCNGCFPWHSGPARRRFSGARRRRREKEIGGAPADPGGRASSRPAATDEIGSPHAGAAVSGCDETSARSGARVQTDVRRRVLRLTSALNPGFTSNGYEATGSWDFAPRVARYCSASCRVIASTYLALTSNRLRSTSSGLRSMTHSSTIDTR
jgi:hypothetical protein